MSNDGKFQDTERFLILCPRHVSSRLPAGGETCKYATVPSTHKKTWIDFLPIGLLLSTVSVFVLAQPSSEFLEVLVNYPVHGKHSHNCEVCRVSFIIEIMWIDFSVYMLGYACIAGVCVVMGQVI
jgi:hypothetical protein